MLAPSKAGSDDGVLLRLFCKQDGDRSRRAGGARCQRLAKQPLACRMAYCTPQHVNEASALQLSLLSLTAVSCDARARGGSDQGGAAVVKT